ncbi:FMN-binding protein [Subtercola sp. PAMC28395]|nr:FMN-binding protein [Subtercola sp. PAMC28395]
MISTRYGTIQVQITVNSGKITDVTALKLTDDGGRSVQISARAAPVLRSEVLSAQSANVASVSGATYTSDGYLQSVQSALDQAGL